MTVKELLIELKKYHPDACVLRLIDKDLCTGVHKVSPSNWKSTNKQCESFNNIIIE